MKHLGRIPMIDNIPPMPEVKREYIYRPSECKEAGCYANCCYADYELNRHQFKDDPRRCKYYKSDSEFCKCLLTPCYYWWGEWLECECGFKNNIKNATFCGGCGKKIQVIGEKSI